MIYGLEEQEEYCVEINCPEEWSEKLKENSFCFIPPTLWCIENFGYSTHSVSWNKLKYSFDTKEEAMRFKIVWG